MIPRAWGVIISCYYLLASSVETSSEGGGGNVVGADGAVGEVEFPGRQSLRFRAKFDEGDMN